MAEKKKPASSVNPIRKPTVRKLGLKVPPLPAPHDAFIPRPDQASIQQIAPTQYGAPIPKTAPAQSEPQPLRQIGATQYAGAIDAEGAEDVEIASAYTKLPNSWPEYVARTFGVYAQVVYLQLFRLSYGFHRDWCQIGYPKLAERSGISVTAARKGAKELLDRGQIEQLAIDVANRDQQSRGIRWRVNIPEGAAIQRIAPTQQTAPIHRARMKENHERKHEKALVAVAPAPDLYKIRETALRIREASGASSASDLRTAVRAWLIGEGHEIDETLIEEALRGMA